MISFIFLMLMLANAIRSIRYMTIYACLHSFLHSAAFLSCFVFFGTLFFYFIGFFAHSHTLIDPKSCFNKLFPKATFWMLSSYFSLLCQNTECQKDFLCIFSCICFDTECCLHQQFGFQKSQWRGVYVLWCNLLLYEKNVAIVRPEAPIIFQKYMDMLRTAFWDLNLFQ
jgi:hypothetical protein